MWCHLLALNIVCNLSGSFELVTYNNIALRPAPNF
jgi:hypothetical protein